MAWMQGQTYQCPDPNCGGEIAITKEPQLAGGGEPMCTCGSSMRLKS